MAKTMELVSNSGLDLTGMREEKINILTGDAKRATVEGFYWKNHNILQTEDDDTVLLNTKSFSNGVFTCKKKSGDDADANKIYSVDNDGTYILKAGDEKTDVVIGAVKSGLDNKIVNLDSGEKTVKYSYWYAGDGKEVKFVLKTKENEEVDIGVGNPGTHITVQAGAGSVELNRVTDVSVTWITGKNCGKSYVSKKHSSEAIADIGGTVIEAFGEKDTLILTDGGTLADLKGDIADRSLTYGNTKLRNILTNEDKVTNISFDYGNTIGKVTYDGNLDSKLKYRSDVKYYIGCTDTGAELDASAEAVPVVINLADKESFSNVNKIKANAGVLIGNTDRASKFTLNTGLGAISQMWGGGAAADTFDLSGAGSDVVWFATGDGNDVVTGFGANDVVFLYNNKEFKNVASVGKAMTVSGGNVLLRVNDGSTLTLMGAGTAGNKVEIAAQDMKAEYTAMFGGIGGDDDIVFDKDVSIYLGNGSDCVKVTDKYTEFDVIGMSLKEGMSDYYFDSSVRSIDASESNAAMVLIGSSDGTSVYGGKRLNQMWGGGAGTQYLGGQTSAMDTFWFGKTDGADIAGGMDAKDSVYLYDVMDINDVKVTVNADDSFVISAGASTLSSAPGISAKNVLDKGFTFHLADYNTQYTYSTETGKFTKK